MFGPKHKTPVAENKSWNRRYTSVTHFGMAQNFPKAWTYYCFIWDSSQYLSSFKEKNATANESKGNFWRNTERGAYVFLQATYASKTTEDDKPKRGRDFIIHSQDLEQDDTLIERPILTGEVNFVFKC